MAVAGVIAEYNPFHKGHAWQISEIRRRLGDDTAVVACMSGNFVQRGDFAVVNKLARAEMALRGGVDLVLELPVFWSAAAAERFAQGGVAVLAAAGMVTHLAFGCECGSAGPLRETVGALERPEYRQRLREMTGTGISFAAARQQVLQEFTSSAQCLSQPNNALAVEYLRALQEQGSEMEPLALPRVGAGHDSGEESDFPSASAVREKIRNGEAWRDCLPEPSAGILSREIEIGRGPVWMDTCERAVLSQLRRMDEENFRVYDGGNEGLYHRFYGMIHTAADLTSILQMTKTKRYPLARLRRMLLQAYLGVPQARQGETPPYIRVLGANGRGRALLGKMRRTAALPVITKPGRIRRMDREVQRVFEQEARCTDLYVLAYPDLRQAGPESEYTVGPVML